MPDTPSPPLVWPPSVNKHERKKNKKRQGKKRKKRRTYRKKRKGEEGELVRLFFRVPKKALYDHLTTRVLHAAKNLRLKRKKK